MKKTFKAEGIKVSYEVTMPMEHESERFHQVLEEIKRKARSEYEYDIQWNVPFLFSLSTNYLMRMSHLVQQLSFGFISMVPELSISTLD